MTPAEFLDYAEGWNWRAEQKKRDIAWQTVNIVNHWRKEGAQLTVDDILKKEDKPNGPMSDEQMAENVVQWALAMGAVDTRKGAK